MADNQADAHIMLDNATAPGVSEVFVLGSDNKAFHAMGNTAVGLGAAVVEIEVSNNLSWPWLTMATIELTLGVVDVADGAVMLAGWKYVRANLVSISGTEAAVSVAVGI